MRFLAMLSIFQYGDIRHFSLITPSAEGNYGLIWNVITFNDDPIRKTIDAARTVDLETLEGLI